MKSKKIIAALCALAVVVSSSGGLPFSGLRLFDTAVTASAADEVSENISLVASDSSNLKTISGTHYSVSCGYLFAGSSGMQVCKSGAMTINARKGETITKVVLTYNWGNNKSSLSASSGTFDGNATISDINAQQVTISSSNTAGVKISAVRVYFEGSLSNPTVTLTGGANAKSSGGLLTQSYLPGAMDTVTYTALTGASFPEFETYTQNGVIVERTSDTVVTISGTPTANTAITVPDAESSGKIVTWDSSIINASGRNGIDYQISRNNSYSDTANGITLTKSGSGYASLYNGDWMTSGDVTLNFTTATGKFTSIEIEASSIYNGGNWTKDGNTLKWNGTPSNSVSLSGSGLYLEGISSINFVIEMPADLSNATVTLGADNKVSSVTVGGNEITDLSEFDITYGTDESHTATEPPTEEGTYYAYVTAKTESENYTGTAKSAAFTVAAAATAPTYTITIPAEVNLKSTDPVEITASGVTLNEGQKIIVTLDGASHTTSGNVFSAETDDGESVVKYKINNGAIGLDDENKTVAQFTEGGSKELSFAVTDETGIKFAGEHSEELTFGVKLETAKTAAEKPDIAQADCTFSPSNGKSTLSNANITTAMEYSADNGTTWTDVTSDGSIASLAAGTVQIRVKETADKLASEAVSITVPEVLHINELVGPYYGDKLTCEYYAGETWQALVDRYDLIKVYSGYAAFGRDGFIYYRGSFVPVTDLVDNTKTYEVG